MISVDIYINIWSLQPVVTIMHVKDQTMQQPHALQISAQWKSILNKYLPVTGSRNKWLYDIKINVLISYPSTSNDISVIGRMATFFAREKTT